MCILSYRISMNDEKRLLWIKIYVMEKKKDLDVQTLWIGKYGYFSNNVVCWYILVPIDIEKQYIEPLKESRGTHEVQRRNVNHFWRCWIYLAQSIHCIGLFCRCSIFGSRQQEHCNLNSLQLQIEFPNATVGLATSAWPFYDTRKSCLEVGKSAFSSLQPLQNGGVIFSVCKSRHKNSPFRGKEYVGRKRLRIDYCTKGP